MEYDNGEVHTISGEQAAKWVESVNGQITIGHIHGIPFPQFDWKIGKRGDCAYDEEGRTVCPVVAKMETKMNTHIHPTGVGPSGPPIYTEKGHKHEVPNNPYITETGEEL